MACEYIGLCGGCSTNLESSLESKIAISSNLLQIKQFESFASKQSGFRARCELGIFHKDNEIFYTMRKAQSQTKSQNTRFICIENCKNLAPIIQQTLPHLLEILNSADFNTFATRLFALEILTNCDDSLLISFIYHRNLQESWLQSAKQLKQKLQKFLNFNFYFIGRSRGVKLVLEQDYLYQHLEILGKNYVYRYDEGAFTQPNPEINAQMIAWVLRHLKDSHTHDLLEMYCGCGNFTIPLSQKFHKVLATEISKTSIKAAQFGCEANGIANISFVRLSGEECIEALNGVRSFNRLKDIALHHYDFKSVFVDPPRAGLGESVCQFLQRFQTIIYISCNPHTLAKDLEILKQTHTICHCAFFDQFPHTQHLECGVILEKQTLKAKNENL